MMRGTTQIIPSDLICPNCKTKDFDVRTIEQTYHNGTYGCIRFQCKNCNYVYSSRPFRIIEPLNEEIKEDV